MVPGSCCRYCRYRRYCCCWCCRPDITRHHVSSSRVSSTSVSSFGVNFDLTKAGCAKTVHAIGGGPDGEKFCVVYPGVLTDAYMNVSSDASHIAVHAVIFGEDVLCTNEAIDYDVKSGVITLTNIRQSGDCIAKYTEQFGIDPSTVSISYDASADDVAISVSSYGISITAKRC